LARLTALERLNRDFRDAYGSRAVSTAQGRAGWDRGQYDRASSWKDISNVLRPDTSITYEVPSRDIALAYLVQEMYAVCSPFARAINQMAGDAGQDSMGDHQPYTILVNEKNSRTKDKITEILDRAYRITQVGLNTEMRIRRALKTGMAIGQPIFEYDGLHWDLVRVQLMPTWEMIRDPKHNTWKQVRNSGGMGNRIIGEWNIPNFLATTTILEDDNQIYGMPIGQLVIADYRMLVWAIEDLAIAGRTRAPRRLVHYIGWENNPIVIDDDLLKKYKQRNSVEPTTILTDHWLKKGFEEIDQLDGDASGVEALLLIVKDHTDRMRRGIGMSAEPSDMSGRGLESVDADYARVINILHMADYKFLKNIGDKALLLKGYTDVDYAALIPALGETEANRWTRASAALERGHIGYSQFCAIVGLKQPDENMADIEKWFEFRKKHGVPLVLGDKEDSELIGASGAKSTRTAKQDVIGTESPAKGADPQKGRTRRAEQRRSGKTPSGA